MVDLHIEDVDVNGRPGWKWAYGRLVNEGVDINKIAIGLPPDHQALERIGGPGCSKTIGVPWGWFGRSSIASLLRPASKNANLVWIRAFPSAHHVLVDLRDMLIAEIDKLAVPAPHFATVGLPAFTPEQQEASWKGAETVLCAATRKEPKDLVRKANVVSLVSDVAIFEINGALWGVYNNKPAQGIVVRRASGSELANLKQWVSS